MFVKSSLFQFDTTPKKWAAAAGTLFQSDTTLQKERAIDGD
jgi:hypothetical protein